MVINWCSSQDQHCHISVESSLSVFAKCMFHQLNLALDESVGSMVMWAGSNVIKVPLLCKASIWLTLIMTAIVTDHCFWNALL